MRKTVLIAMAMLLVAGAAFAKEFEATKKAGEYEVRVTLDKTVVGSNDATVEVKDASGKYVTDAKVVIEYSMPAMAGMPPMNYKANAELKGEKYAAKMNLSMSGSWNVTVKITRAGKTERVKFTVDAR